MSAGMELIAERKEVAAALFWVERAGAAYRKVILATEWPEAMSSREAQAFREARVVYAGAVSRLTLAANKVERCKMGVSREQFAAIKNGTFKEEEETEP